MNRNLWTVFSDQRLVAVVAAEELEDAKTIVAALEERNDLPGGSRLPVVLPATKRQANKVLRQARSMGVADQFLAFLLPGIFMTGIGGIPQAA